MSSHFSLHVPSRPALYTSASNMERFDEDGTTLSDLENDVPTSDDEYMVSDDESDPEEIGHASRLTSSTKARRSKSTSPDADEQFSRTDYRKKIFDSITLKLSPSNDEFRRKRQIRPHTQEEFWKLILESDEKLASARRRLAQTTENRQKEKRKSCDDKLQKKEKTASLSRKVGQLDESLKEARQEIKTLRETAVSREKIIQGMKDQRLNTEAGNFDADADQPVASELASLFQSSKSFSARWTLGDWSKIDAQMKKVLLDKLRDMPNLVSQHGQTAIAHQLISPRVIVNALLNQALVGLTLANPWKVFDGIEFYSHKFFLAEVLERIYDMHEKANKEQLRCLLMMKLKPEKTGIGNIVKDAGLKERAESYSFHVRDQALEAVGFLLKTGTDDVEQIKTALMLMARRFIVTSVAIHAQYPLTKFFWRIPRLKNYPFSYPHEHMQPHPAMQLKDDEDEGDGRTAQEAGVLQRKLDLAIVPLVLRSGDKQGKVWQGKRILQRAVVWVCNPEEVLKAAKEALQAKYIGLHSADILKQSGDRPASSTARTNPHQHDRQNPSAAAIVTDPDRRQHSKATQDGKKRKADVEPADANKKLKPNNQDGNSSSRRREATHMNTGQNTRIAPNDSNIRANMVDLSSSPSQQSSPSQRKSSGLRVADETALSADQAADRGKKAKKRSMSDSADVIIVKTED